MAPAASFACTKEELKFTFTYLNCALQHENLNRGVWKSLELYERELAKTQKVKVHVQIHFSKKSKVLPSGATIPDAFTKTLFYGKIKKAYRFENCKPIHREYNKYLIES
jgi:DNA/RNA endonuclease G (NUC1)